jgi:hypothetical protein
MAESTESLITAEHVLQLIIAVFVDDQEDARLVEKRLLNEVSDYGETHGTFTLCLVWHKRAKALAGAR